MIESNRICRSFLVLESNQRVLGRTQEKIGSNCRYLTSQLAARSTWGRWGLEVCSCAGYGDPGYASHWTLEILNKNSFKVKIKPGIVVGQIYFDRVEDCRIMYQSKYNEKKDPFERMIPKNLIVFEF